MRFDGGGGKLGSIYFVEVRFDGEVEVGGVTLLPRLNPPFSSTDTIYKLFKYHLQILLLINILNYRHGSDCIYIILLQYSLQINYKFGF